MLKLTVANKFSCLQFLLLWLGTYVTVCIKAAGQILGLAYIKMSHSVHELCKRLLTPSSRKKKFLDRQSFVVQNHYYYVHLSASQLGQILREFT